MGDGTHNDLFQRTPYQSKMVKHLINAKAFTFSFAIGCKTIQMSKQLSVRATPRPLDFRELTSDLMRDFRGQKMNDRQELTKTLMQFKIELEHHCQVNMDNLDQIRKY